MTLGELIAGFRRMQYHLPRRFWREGDGGNLTPRQHYLAAMSFSRWQKRVAPPQREAVRRGPECGVGDIAMLADREALMRATMETRTT